MDIDAGNTLTLTSGGLLVTGASTTINVVSLLDTDTFGSGNLTFSFVRDQASIDPFTTVEIQAGTDLATWPATYSVGADTAGSSIGVTVTKDNPTVGLDTITLSVPQGLDPKKFARLKVLTTL